VIRIILLNSLRFWFAFVHFLGSGLTESVLTIRLDKRLRCADPVG